MPAKTVRVPTSPTSSVSFRSLSAPSTLLGIDDARDAQVDLGEVVDGLISVASATDAFSPLRWREGEGA